MILSNDSKYTFVWHDNSGQTLPDIDSTVTYNIGTCGLTIDIAANVVITQPIIIISSAAAHNNCQHQINIGKNSKVQLIEFMLADDHNANNQVKSTINCADGSQIEHCILQHATTGKSIEQSITSSLTLSANSTANSNVFAFGGSENNVSVDIALTGSNASCNAANLAYTFAKEKQTVLFNIQHQHANCTSNSLSRSVAKDSSFTDFTGKIFVVAGASKSQADLQIKNLLCSTKAQANNKPELEIYNDDVKCSHGSSTGNLDPNALFYMQSRGIDLQQATAMLIDSFIQPVIATCKMPCITNYVEQLIAERSA